MKTSTIIFLEVGMLLGIVMSAFMVPRSTPLLRFGIIGGGAFLLGNIALFAQARQLRKKYFQLYSGGVSYEIAGVATNDIHNLDAPGSNTQCPNLSDRQCSAVSQVLAAVFSEVAL